MKAISINQFVHKGPIKGFVNLRLLDIILQIGGTMKKRTQIMLGILVLLISVGGAFIYYFIRTQADNSDVVVRVENLPISAQLVETSLSGVKFEAAYDDIEAAHQSIRVGDVVQTLSITPFLYENGVARHYTEFDEFEMHTLLEMDNQLLAKINKSIVLSEVKIEYKGVIYEALDEEILIDSIEPLKVHGMIAAFESTHPVSLEIDVSDTTAPKISGTKDYRVEVGTKVDYKKDVIATDDFDDDVSLEFSGDVNFNKAGTYTIKVLATDSSGNSAKDYIEVFVKAKPVNEEVIKPAPLPEKPAPKPEPEEPGEGENNPTDPEETPETPKVLGKVAIIIGHGYDSTGKYDSGAIGYDGTHEYVLNKDVAYALKTSLESYNVAVDLYDENVYRNIKFNEQTYNFSQYDFIVEVHFNASPIGAVKKSGTEVIYNSYNKKDLSVHRALASYLGALTGKGIIYQDDEFVTQRTIASQGTQSCLLEVGYIDNAKDVNAYRSKKTEYIDAIARGILTYWE